MTFAWQKPTDAVGAIAHYVLSASPPVENCDPYCTVGPSTSQFTFIGLEAEMRYNLSLRADNCEGTQEGLEYKLTDITIQSEFSFHINFMCKTIIMCRGKITGFTNLHVFQ